MRVVALLLLLAAGGVAHAAGAQCTATEIVASNDKKGLDPALARFKNKLSQPPMSSFDSFRFLGEKGVTLEQQKPTTTGLRYGKLTLLFKEKSTDKKGRGWIKLAVELEDSHGHREISSTASFDLRDALIITGRPFEGGTYVLALACQTP